MAARCMRISVNYFLAIGEFYLKGFENFLFDE